MAATAAVSSLTPVRCAREHACARSVASCIQSALNLALFCVMQGTLVWFRKEPIEWALGVVQDLDASSGTVKIKGKPMPSHSALDAGGDGTEGLDGGQLTCSCADVFPVACDLDPARQGAPNMVTISNLSEPDIIYNLRLRT